MNLRQLLLEYLYLETLADWLHLHLPHRFMFLLVRLDHKTRLQLVFMVQSLKGITAYFMSLSYYHPLSGSSYL